MPKADKELTIYIGGDMDKDERELLETPKGLDQPTNILYLDSYEQLDHLLSPKKLDLLRYLIQENKKGGEKSVGEIASELNRQQEAISRDLHYLKNLKLVDLRKVSQTVYPHTEFQSINIEMVLES